MASFFKFMVFLANFGFHKLKDLALMLVEAVVVGQCNLRNKVEVIFTIYPQ
jgi:hypothetical protein